MGSKAAKPVHPYATGEVDASWTAVGLRQGRRVTRAASGRLHAPKTSAAKSKTAAGVVRIPAFDALPWLRAGFSTRQGGASLIYAGDSNPKGELNLGWTKEDTDATVATNRHTFVRAVAGKSPMELATVRQFHSNMVRLVEAGHGPLTTPTGRAVLRGDALMTDLPGLMIGVQTADCVPVLLADTRTHAVAAFHAGWRGTLARVVESGVGFMRLRYGSRPKDLVAAIGPAIGSCCFAVGEEVRHQFESQFTYAPKLFSEVYDSDPVREKYPLLFLTARAPGHSSLGLQIHLDLFEANRRQLLAAGLKPKNITVTGECTACTRLADGRRKYFSHRAEQGFTGRMLSVIGRVSG